MAKDYSFMDAVEEALKSPARRASRVIGAAKGVQGAINTGVKRVLRESPVTGASRVVKAIRNVKDTYDDEVADTISAPVESAKKILVTPRVTPALQRDGDGDPMTSTTYGDYQGGNGSVIKFIPKDFDKIYYSNSGRSDIESSRKESKDYDDNRALDNMPSRLPEIKAKRESVARNAQQFAGEMGNRNTQMDMSGVEKGMAQSKSERNAPQFASDMDNRSTQMDMSGVEKGMAQSKSERNAQQFASDMGNRSTQMDMSGVEKGMAQSKADSAYSARATAVFKKATGTAFDPKSKVDRARLKELEDVIRSNPKLADASDNKISMAWYARTKKK